MKPIVLIIFVLFISQFNLAQSTFEKTYGNISNNDYLYHMDQTSDNGYIMVGKSSYYININDSLIVYSNIFLIKTNDNGTTEWSKEYDSFHRDIGTSVIETTDNGYFIIGYSIDTITEFIDIFAIKTNSFGDTLWTKTYSYLKYNKPFSVQQTDDGGYIIGGYFYDNIPSYNSNIFLLKLNSEGDELWIKEFGGEENEVLNDLKITSDGGYIFTGSTTSYGNGGFDIYLVKTDDIGNTIFTTTYGGYSSDIGNSIQQTEDGYILAGNTWSFNPIDDRKMDAYILKLNFEGDTVWTKRLGWSSYETCKSIAQTNDYGYILTGYTESFGNQFGDLYITKTNSLGEILWSEIYGSVGGSFGKTIFQTDDEGYIIAGSTSKNSSDWIFDYYLIKTNQNGLLDVGETGNYNQKEKLIHPNPVENELNIYYKNTISEINIISLKGEIILNLKDIESNCFNLDVTNLPSGGYIIQLHTENKTLKDLFIKL